MNKVGVILILGCITGFLVDGSVHADQAGESRAQFKAKLAIASGQPGPFSRSEDFPKTYFLIPDNLPYMVGLTLIHPMSKTLNLSDKQKSRIQAIQKETIPYVIKTASQIKSLELDLVQRVINDEDPNELIGLVDKVGNLRIELTKKHLNCIKQVRDILSMEQYKILLSYAAKSNPGN